MSFKIAARTVLQLGAELISSDELAFYELVKNAIDARSPSVEIRVVVRIVHRSYVEIRRDLEVLKKKGGKLAPGDLENWREQIYGSIIPESVELQGFRDELSSAQSISDLLRVLAEANYIEIEDWGHGMSLDDLKNAYLTIGTRSRYLERKNSRDDAPILGEKGVGRLSAMRLGNRLLVLTGMSRDRHWNELFIDWGWFSHESDELLSNVRISPRETDSSKSTDETGTLIRISALATAWNEARIREMAEHNFSRFADPFNPSVGYPIDITFNGSTVLIPEFDKDVLKYAHATVTAAFESKTNTKGEIECTLKGKILYRLRGESKAFVLDNVSLVSATRIDLRTLHSLGPFQLKAYWFNRQLLRKGEIPDAVYVKSVVSDWGGGLMLFRDGYRVFPYGSKDDDWLNLDKKALASSGYKVNRSQVIGKVDITHRDNPALTDQTNREGLRENDEKRALVALLKYVLETEMRVFLRNVDNKLVLERQFDFSVIEDRFDKNISLARSNVQHLIESIPESERDLSTINRLQEQFRILNETMSEAKQLAESYKEGTELSVHLAGVGLLVETLAHELNRSASNALSTVAHVRKDDLPTEVKNRFKSLEIQMKTLQKRLQILDPVGTATRRRKSTFDLVGWIREIMDGHVLQFEQYGITHHISVLPTGRDEWKVKLVKGMIVQVIENLVANSIYWLRLRQEVATTQFLPWKGEDKDLKLEKILLSDRSFKPRIDITIDINNHEIEFSDNGPGVDPELRDEIFLPYVTRKPSGEGKGLGLYISREIATFHDAKLFLSPEPLTSRSNRLNTFIFRLPKNSHDHD